MHYLYIHRMLKTSIFRRQPRRRDVHGRSGTTRRLLALPFLGLVTAAMFLIAPALASADTSSSLTVIGTSDVSDSGLIPNVIQPGFQKAFPQYTFKYIGTGTGNAIAMAESGAAGASNLIVHAASLENQFVAGGYSFEQYGRALWTNDFVLAGPNSDPAGIATGAPNNIAQAFADVAAAGINAGGTPKVTFVSRGGTPGTTVSEHGIWQIVDSSGLSPAGLLLCTVSSANGGGETPIAAGHGVTASGQPCPNSGALPTGTALPSWYAATGLTQGPNVQAANACNGFPSGPNSCYVFTDSGTYDYLNSGTDPAGTIPALKVVTSDNSANAPGGQFELINYFHGYIINPNKPGQTVNLPAAQAFLNYITSPAVQAQVAAYLEGHGNPFTPTASPLLKSSKIPAKFVASGGKKLKVTGTLTNAQPGYPVLSGEPVAISKVVDGLPVSVATGKTNSQGKYSISFVPPTSGSYEVTTNQISKVEEPTLNPVFGDLLSPAATTPVKITVHSVITQLASTSQGGQALVRGQVSPGTGHVKATVTLFATQFGSKKGFKKVATYKLAANDANFAVVLPKLGQGTWLVKAKYSDPGQVVAAPDRTIKVTVGAKPNTSVSFSSVKVAKTGGKVTVSGTIKPGAPASGATIEVLTMKTSGSPPQFGEKTTVKVGSGKTKFTVHFKLKTGFRFVLRLVNKQTGQSPSDTGLKTINVK
jgi:tungstate transport system substrate-binding protein